MAGSASLITSSIPTASATAGFVIVGVFVLAWAAALAIWRFGRIEQKMGRPHCRRRRPGPAPLALSAVAGTVQPGNCPAGAPGPCCQGLAERQNSTRLSPMAQGLVAACTWNQSPHVSAVRSGCALAMLVGSQVGSHHRPMSGYA